MISFPRWSFRVEVINFIILNKIRELVLGGQLLFFAIPGCVQTARLSGAEGSKHLKVPAA
jgi:hypothetical protein